MDLREVEEKINQKMGELPHPKFRKTLGELGVYGSLEQEGDLFRLFVKVPDEDRKVHIELETKVRGEIRDLIPGKLKIKFEYDPELQPEDPRKRIDNVKYIIAVGSGKGGVGKSTVSTNLAATLSKRGLKVGLLDGDIYGPSLGGMLGREGRQPLRGDGQERIFPEEIHGLKIISFSFLLDDEQAVLWRGPMLGRALEQLLYEIHWGSLDFLIIDLPPGTGDVQLSLSQLVDLDGSIIVTTPQKVSLYDATRALSMFREVKIPVLGIIENMSEFICPGCGEATHIFSQDGGKNFAEKYKIPHLGGLPLKKEIMQSGEEGTPYVLAHKDDQVVEAYEQIADKLLKQLEQ